METKRNEIVTLGDGAVSYAAIDAGVKGVFGYPGTPSTEVFEEAEALIKKLDDGRVAMWGANEKAAYEMALGSSYAGFRSIVTMKHVGLNVAMDAFVNSAMTGANGGLVVLVADDPSMHSSQNEQDSRYLADFAHVPCLEPSTPQELYDATLQAFEISERLKLPVLLKVVTRLSHSRGFLRRGETKEVQRKDIVPIKDTMDWVLVPSKARIIYDKLREKYPEIEASVAEFNSYKEGKERVAVVASGMGRAYYNQLMTEQPELKGKYHELDIAAYPIKESLLTDLIDKVDEIYVFEENYPYIEDKLRSYANKTNVKVHGRRDKTLPISGELTPIGIRTILGLEIPEAKKESSLTPPSRLPRLCQGCGHIDAFLAMGEAAKNVNSDQLRFYGDIGCYTLGAYPPFDSIHTCVEMGASQGMALGAALVGATPAVGIMGDSTFFHSGLPNLIALAKTDVNATFVIMDNRAVAMTGQQKTITIDNIPEVVKGAGFREDQIVELVPLKRNHEENVKAFEKVLRNEGPNVVIFRRECIEAARKKINQ